jgi:hypothetical protein
MRQVVVLADAVTDLEAARDFYNAREPGIGEPTSLLADIASLALFHGVHSHHYGSFRMLASRFPFGIYYVETTQETRVVAVLDLRRSPSWLRKELKQRQR